MLAAFERDVRGSAKAGFGYAGFDMGQGTPMAVLGQNARDLITKQKFVSLIIKLTNMQIMTLKKNKLMLSCPYGRWQLLLAQLKAQLH